MSLSDIIRKVHGPDKLAVLLDQHVLATEKADNSREYGWHPSEFVGMCARQSVLAKRYPSKEEDEGFPASLLRIFHVGHALHAWYQNNYFGAMGIIWGKWQCLRCDGIHWGIRPIGKTCHLCKGGARWDYKEVPLKAILPEGIKKCIVGHCDGIIRIRGKWYVLEIKTINTDGFTWQKKAAPKHVLQVQVYGELIRQGKVRLDGANIEIPPVSGIIILYIDKNNSKEREYILEFDQAAARAEIAKPYLVEMAMKNNTLPCRREECVNMLQKPAKVCPMVSYCFGG